MLHPTLSSLLCAHKNPANVLGWQLSGCGYRHYHLLTKAAITLLPTRYKYRDVGTSIRRVTVTLHVNTFAPMFYPSRVIIHMRMSILATTTLQLQSDAPLFKFKRFLYVRKHGYWLCLQQFRFYRTV